MKEIKKEDIKQEVFDLYDAYAHNRIDRRLFMDKLSTVCCWRHNRCIAHEFYQSQLSCHTGSTE